jgi:ATP phosphoribosyltransferase regulatory subunit
MRVKSMPRETAREFEALDAQARRLMTTFTHAGYEHVSPAIIQPAGLLLDVVGEGLRARTYVFTDPGGEELCLRPDLTVPTCRLHLARYPDGSTPARYCYSGSAFRYQPSGADSAHPREFRQAGVESFAAADREQSDADVVAVIIEALRDAGLARVHLRIGDLGLFNAVLDALPMPPRWRRRLKHHFWRPEAFRAEVARLTSQEARAVKGLPQTLADRLDPANRDEALDLVADYLNTSGIELIGTRTLVEISERLLAEVADSRQSPLGAEHAALIEAYVAVKSPAASAAKRLQELARRGKIDLASALDAFARRLDLLQQAGVDIKDAEFSAEFGRNLEYYTGFVFELVAPELGPRSAVAGGGRYDGLLADVGAPRAVPAVGSCIHTERLLWVLQGGKA